MITRALGIDRGGRKRTSWNHALKKDDRFLLCTDGLTEMVATLRSAGSSPRPLPGRLFSKLMDAANERGGVDNITAVVVWVTEV